MKNLEIREIEADKKRYLDLLLLGDEEEEMIDLYLYRGDMYVLFKGDMALASIVITDEEEFYEIKNIAVKEDYQRLGLGKKLIEYVVELYRDKYDYIYVGTGNSPLTIPFYKSLGFIEDHVVENFFIDNYREEIIEGGVRLVHMIYLKKALKKD